MDKKDNDSGGSDDGHRKFIKRQGKKARKMARKIAQFIVDTDSYIAAQQLRPDVAERVRKGFKELLQLELKFAQQASAVQEDIATALSGADDTSRSGTILDEVISFLDEGFPESVAEVPGDLDEVQDFEDLGFPRSVPGNSNNNNEDKKKKKKKKKAASCRRSRSADHRGSGDDDGPDDAASGDGSGGQASSATSPGTLGSSSESSNGSGGDHRNGRTKLRRTRGMQDLAYAVPSDAEHGVGTPVAVVSRKGATIVTKEPRLGDQLVGWTVVANVAGTPCYTSDWPSPHVVVPDEPHLPSATPVIMLGFAAVLMDGGAGSAGAVYVNPTSGLGCSDPTDATRFLGFAQRKLTGPNAVECLISLRGGLPADVASVSEQATYERLKNQALEFIRDQVSRSVVPGERLVLKLIDPAGQRRTWATSSRLEPELSEAAQEPPQQDRSDINEFLQSVREENVLTLKSAQSRNILFVGKSRAGKTTTSMILQDPTHISAKPNIFSREEDRKTVNSLFSVFDGRHAVPANYNINIIDTPGLFEEDTSDERLGQMILDCLDKEITSIHCVFFVASVPTGINRGDIKVLQAFARMFKGMETNCALLVTRCEGLRKDEREHLRSELWQEEDFSELLGLIGGRVFFTGALRADSVHFREHESVKIQLERVAEMRSKLLDFIFSCSEPFHLRHLEIFARKSRRLTEIAMRLRQLTQVPQQCRTPAQKQEMAKLQSEMCALRKFAMPDTVVQVIGEE